MPPFVPRKRLQSDSPPAESSRSKAKVSRTTATTPAKPSLFDALDASATSRKSAQTPKGLIAELDGSDDDSSLSSLSSLSSSEPDFEDVPVAKRAKLSHTTSDVEDDDIEFEDVETHNAQPSVAPPPSGDLDLTLTKDTRVSLVNPHNKKQGPSKIERQIRISTHQMHVQFLMWHNALRNAWLCDKELQAILVDQARKMSTIQKEIQRWRINSCLDNEEDKPIEISRKSNRNDKRKGKAKAEKTQRDWGTPAQRVGKGVDMSHGDPLFKLLVFIARLWKQCFRFDAPGLRKMGYMTLQRLDEEIKSFKETHDVERHGERIRDRKELRNRAKTLEGSRDLGAQLFVALLRGLGLEARMVVSLQPVGFGWSKGEDAAERKEKKKSTTTEVNSTLSDDTDLEELGSRTSLVAKSTKGKSAASAPRSTRKPLSKAAKEIEPIEIPSSEDDDDSVVDMTPVRPKRGPSKMYEKDLSPNYWAEVLSPVTNQWVAVNPFGKEPVATNSDLLAGFEPRGAKSEKFKQVMCYIIGFSSDGTAKDVTVRYLKRKMWPGKTKGFRLPVEKVPVYNQKGKIKRHEEYDWFKTVMSGYNRRDKMRKPADDIEEATALLAVKPERKEAKEGEETLQTYKSSAEYVLERHLRREEALLPHAQHVKMFTVKGKKGEEPTDEKVFLRKDVVNCKSVETWHKEGREPMLGEQPLKRVPYRAATTNRKRELAEAEAASGGEKMLQGLYSRDQTDWIIPPPIENGVIPKNAFGNMDVYVPSMVPAGAVHLPYRSTMRICKKLGIDYAEAVTGFEFGARMAIPVITGVVVAEEHGDLVMEQWKIDEAERVRKEDEKRTKAAIGMWRKFLMGMRIVERVREEYGDQGDTTVDELNPWTNQNAKSRQASNMEDITARRLMDQREEEMGGGFLPEGQDVEEPAQSFIPVRYDDEDEGDEDDGGFIVENGDVSSNPHIDAYATPVSLPPVLNKSSPMTSPGHPKHENDDPEGPSRATKRRSGATKAAKTPAKKSQAKATTSSDTRKRPVKTPKPSRTASKPKSKSKSKAAESASEASSVENGAQESELSSLSDLDSDDEVLPKPRRQAATPKKTAVTPRSVPRRAAARKSETALRSHYFEAGDDDEDGD